MELDLRLRALELHLPLMLLPLLLDPLPLAGWLALERNPGLEMGLELGEMLMLHLIIPPLLPARFNRLSNGVHLCLHF